jgi:hypothetical protein
VEVFDSLYPRVSEGNGSRVWAWEGPCEGLDSDLPRVGQMKGKKRDPLVGKCVSMYIRDKAKLSVKLGLGSWEIN